jgi:hypothetical protein
MCAITIQVLPFLTVASLAALLFLTNPAYLPISSLAIASSNVGGGALSATPIIHNNKGPVIQETVNTRNSEFDMQVSKFYSCISKVTHEPVEPLKIQVDHCYLQVFGTGSINMPVTLTLKHTHQLSVVQRFSTHHRVF